MCGLVLRTDLRTRQWRSVKFDKFIAWKTSKVVWFPISSATQLVSTLLAVILDRVPCLQALARLHLQHSEIFSPLPAALYRLRGDDSLRQRRLSRQQVFRRMED